MRRGALVKQDADGIWYSRPYLGKNKITGKPIRPYKRFPEAKTEAEAQRIAEKWIATQTEAAKYGVGTRLDELLTSYIDLLEAQHKPINTIKTHRSTLRCYIAPNIGKTDIGEFTAATAQALYNVVLMQESRRGGTISPNTVLKMHWLLAAAFRHFVGSGICAHNPMPFVTRPVADTQEALAYDEGEFARLQAYLLDVMAHPAESDDAKRLRAVAFCAYMSLWHGTREGETVALSTADAQLWRSNLHVHCNMVEKTGQVIREPKTKGKRSRNLHIYEDPGEQIRQHLAWAESRIAHAEGIPRMLATMPDGTYIRPSDLSHWYNAMIRDELKLPRATHYHTLRHTHATWMILSGADIVTVAERLGHVKESLTLEKYGHLMPGRDEEAVAAFAEFARRASNMGGMAS